MSVQGDSSNAPRIVAGVDGSPSSRAALRWAVRQAILTDGTVEAVMAWQQTFVPGGYGGAPVAMIADVNYQDISVSLHCVQHARCPVLIMRGAEQV
jgi:nucleotide-binding universal stress UspA family protein